jgi:hypothetical protein
MPAARVIPCAPATTNLRNSTSSSKALKKRTNATKNSF